jgi:16S rRNA (cytosine967-C5)-methyltransferase
VAAQPHERVLDVCASPGGKTTAMAAAMRDSGLVVACDVRAARVSLLRQTVAASGATHVPIVHLDTDGELPFVATFDRVLVDAPCSGLGTLRRDPDIRWRRTAADLPALAAAQQQLLARAARVVAPGGRLVYATCSSEPDENDAVVEAFLREHADYLRLDLRTEGDAALRDLTDAQGQLRTLPFAHGLEAFFAAALVRRR